MATLIRRIHSAVLSRQQKSGNVFLGLNVQLFLVYLMPVENMTIHLVYNVSSTGSHAKTGIICCLLIENDAFVRSMAPQNGNSCFPCCIFLYIMSMMLYRTMHSVNEVL